MGVKDVLSRKEGVIVGDDVKALFKYAQENNFAMPAINVTSSSTVVAALEAARDNKAPVILQMSQGGAAYFCGKGVSNTDQAASIAGAVAGAHYIRSVAPAYGIPVVLHTDHCAKKLLPWLDGMMDADEKYFEQHGEPLFSSHMIDLSEEEVDYNIKTTASYLKRAAPMKQWLEMEIGITGGEEDGVNNEGEWHTLRGPNLTALHDRDMHTRPWILVGLSTDCDDRCRQQLALHPARGHLGDPEDAPGKAMKSNLYPSIEHS